MIGSQPGLASRARRTPEPSHRHLAGRHRRVRRGEPGARSCDDYPHLEGTHGHTQETLNQAFEGVDPRIKDRVLRGTFEELITVSATEDLTVAS